MSYNGKTVAVPFANGGKWMYYNKQMLEDAGYSEPPKTWDELKAMSQEMIEKGICKYGIAWGASQAEGLICDLTTMIYSFGGTWQNEDGTFNINNEGSKDHGHICGIFHLIKTLFLERMILELPDGQGAMLFRDAVMWMMNL